MVTLSSGVPVSGSQNLPHYMLIPANNQLLLPFLKEGHARIHRNRRDAQALLALSSKAYTWNLQYNLAPNQLDSAPA